MSEQLTTNPGNQSRRGDWARLLSRRRRAALVAAIVLAVTVGVIAWVVVASRDGSSAAKGPTANPVAPIRLSASGLSTLARVAGQPIYWAGPRAGYFYELSRTSNGNVYIRYLPRGVKAGANGGKYLVIATYRFPAALAALKKVDDGRGIQLPGGGLALVDGKTSKSVHLAFPKVNYQVEVYDPSPARALETASSGQVRPVR